MFIPTLHSIVKAEKWNCVISGKITFITQDWEYANIKSINFDYGYVMESTGTLATAGKIRAHLKGRAKIFIIIIAFYGTLYYWHKTKEFDKYLNISPTA